MQTTLRPSPRVRRAAAPATARTAPPSDKPPKESRIGKVPIPVPTGLTVTLENAYIKVKVCVVVWREC